jgi:hypothetical protein
MSFTIVPPTPPRRPVALYKVVNKLIWQTHCIAIAATAIAGPPPVYADYVLQGLVDAMRDAANRIEQHQHRLKQHEQTIK